MKSKHLLYAIPMLAMGFASCSNEEIKPQSIMTGETIKTSLAINVPLEGYTTRQTAQTTQNGSFTYRGMQDLYLFPLTTAPEIAQKSNPIQGKGQQLASPNTISTADNTHVYSNVQLPIGAQNFLLYGRATPITPEDKFANGVLNRTMTLLDDNTEDISFALQNVISDANVITDPQDVFVGYLNSLAGITGWSTSTDPNLIEAYKQFTLTSAKGNRAGSAFMIKQHVQDLYDKMVLIQNISENATVDGIAGAVMTAISAAPFVVDEGVVNWATVDPSITNFPQKQGLPDGAAILTCTSGNFAYQNAAPTNGMVVLDIFNITYPAELYYYVNTPLWATSKTMESSWWQTTSAAWTGVAWNDASGFAGKNVIDVTTRTVALQNNINYGVACLKTTVKCNSTTLQDNAKTVAGAVVDQTINVPVDGFPVTAILVGGQPNQVDWNFVQNDPTSPNEKTVYDKVEDATMYAKAGISEGENYTMLLDNYDADMSQNTVNVALELTNTSGQGFYGVEGYIPAGAKFYLIAKLDMTAAGVGNPGDIADIARRRYPAYNKKRIFMQDYLTTADFNIKSLQKAYVTIPDMRSIKLELGVSVDLDWIAGFNFNVDID